MIYFHLHNLNLTAKTTLSDIELNKFPSRNKSEQLTVII